MELVIKSHIKYTHRGKTNTYRQKQAIYTIMSITLKESEIHKP